MIEAAIAATSFGCVLPISNVDKRPWVEFALATRDARRIEQLWRSYPGAGLGVLAHTGSLLVLDVEHPDKKPGCPDGFATLRELQARLGELPATRRHRTKSGGEHWVFHRPDSANLRSAQGRLRGAYLSAPGIDVVTGRAVLRWPPTHGYTLIDDTPVAQLPAAWVDAMRDPPEQPCEPMHVTSPEQLERYADRALELECAEVASKRELRNVALCRAAYKLGTLGRYLSATRVQTALMQACEMNGSAREDRRKCLDTIRRCYRSGLKRPRDIRI